MELIEQVTEKYNIERLNNREMKEKVDLIKTKYINNKEETLQ